MYCKHHRNHNWHHSNNVNSNLNASGSVASANVSGSILDQYGSQVNSGLTDNGSGGSGLNTSCRGVVPVVTTVGAGGVVQSTVMRMNLPSSHGDGSHQLSHVTHLPPHHQLSASVTQQQQRRQPANAGVVHDNACAVPTPSSLSHDHYPHPHSTGGHHSHFLNDPTPSGQGVVVSVTGPAGAVTTSSDEYYQLNETDNLEINWPQDSITSVNG